MNKKKKTKKKKKKKKKKKNKKKKKKKKKRKKKPTFSSFSFFVALAQETVARGNEIEMRNTENHKYSNKKQKTLTHSFRLGRALFTSLNLVHFFFVWLVFALSLASITRRAQAQLP
jgi:hypothetical protein